MILDTNIIIDHLRQAKTQDTYLIRIAHKIGPDQLAISVITVQELYEGISTRDAHKETVLLSVIAPLTIFPYTYEVACGAGQIARDLAHPITFADAAIAATAIMNNTSLYTLNRKHFTGIKDLKLISY